MPAVRVSGGVLNGQTLAGSLRFFKVVGGAAMFTNTVGLVDGGGIPTIIVPGAATVGGNPPITTQFFVGEGQPVPGSAAERIVKLLIEKATLVQFAVVGDELHLAFENTAFGWGYTVDNAVPPVPVPVAVEMQEVIQGSGPTDNGIHGAGAPGSNDPPVPNTTNDGTTVDLGAVTVEEVPFALA